jgi:alanyl-tRNA synthetase
VLFRSLISITREEEQFQRTLDRATVHLEALLDDVTKSGQKILAGALAADLYTTYGMPFEITRDIAKERGLDVDEDNFNASMQEHRQASGAGKAMGDLGGEDVEVYRQILQDLQAQGSLTDSGIVYEPYNRIEVSGPVLSFIHEGRPVQNAKLGDEIEVVLPETCFYIESGGQVSDTGIIRSMHGEWIIEIHDMRKPAAGLIVHIGKVVDGEPKVGDEAIASVDVERRRDIMRNHTATHLLHAELHRVLGEHALQAGSLVTPDRLRFDFNHPEAVSKEQLIEIEAGVNRYILGDYPLKITSKPYHQAVSEGATALFGEKYGETVRTITIGGDKPFSYELCGGTHVRETGDIGVCLITSEGSVAAGIRRIEAVTGRKAYELIQHRFDLLNKASSLLGSTPEIIPEKVTSLLDELSSSRKQIAALNQGLVTNEFIQKLHQVKVYKGINILSVILNEADAETLRQMVDRFRQQFSTKGVIVLGSVRDGRPTVVAGVTDDLVSKCLNAVDLIRFVAAPFGGGGGGKPTLAQAGGKDATKLAKALDGVESWVEKHLTA